MILLTGNMMISCNNQKMTGLNKRLQDAKLEHEKTLLQRQVEVTDAAIDALVFELYGLTAEEIRIVEGKA